VNPSLPLEAELRVQIAARHCDIPSSVRERTESQISRLTRYDERLTAAEVVYDEVKHNRKVEVILTVDGAAPLVAEAEGAEFRTALDKVVDRLGRMLRRQRAQATNHQGPRLAEEVTPD
jgi:ribosomal subunit interface protein